jgi:hypothetical protein
MSDFLKNYLANDLDPESTSSDAGDPCRQNANTRKWKAIKDIDANADLPGATAYANLGVELNTSLIGVSSAFDVGPGGSEGLQGYGLNIPREASGGQTSQAAEYHLNQRNYQKDSVFERIPTESPPIIMTTGHPSPTAYLNPHPDSNRTDSPLAIPNLTNGLNNNDPRYHSQSQAVPEMNPYNMFFPEPSLLPNLNSKPGSAFSNLANPASSAYDPFGGAGAGPEVFDWTGPPAPNMREEPGGLTYAQRVQMSIVVGGVWRGNRGVDTRLRAGDGNEQGMMLGNDATGEIQDDIAGDGDRSRSAGNQEPKSGPTVLVPGEWGWKVSNHEDWVTGNKQIAKEQAGEQDEGCAQDFTFCA